MKKRLVSVEDIYEKLLRAEARLDALERKPRAGRPPERMDQCIDWLEHLLRKGAVAVSYLMRDGHEEGFTVMMIRKAGKRLSVVSDRKVWRLP